MGKPQTNFVNEHYKVPLYLVLTNSLEIPKMQVLIERKDVVDA